MSIIVETTEMRDVPESNLLTRTEGGQNEDIGRLMRAYDGGRGGGGATSGGVSTLSICPDTRLEVETAEDALMLATPTYLHETDRKLFILNRALLAVELKRGTKLSVTELKDVFDRWYERAAELRLLRVGETKDNYLKKFMKGRRYAKKPLGPTLDFSRLLAAVDAAPLPPEADLFEDLRARRLVGLCHLLQEAAGDAPFYLSCRKAATALGVEDYHMTADWLFCLVSAGVLDEISKGAGFTASRYRYR